VMLMLMMIAIQVHKRLGKGVAISLFSVLAAFPSMAATEYDFRASVDRTSVATGERLTYTITLSGTSTSLPDVSPPGFEQFEIIMGPSSSTSVQIVNTRITSTQTLTWVLRALQPGSFTIGPAQFKQKSRIYKTGPILIQVGASSAAGSGTGSSHSETSSRTGQGRDDSSLPQASGIRAGAPPDIFISASADKSTLYKFDRSVVTYRLYLRANVSNYNFAKLPAATGFWQEEFEIPARPSLSDATVGGVAYKVAVIRKVGLFPTRAGSLTLDPLTCDVTVERQTSRRNRDPFDIFWDDPFFGRTRREVVTVSTDPLRFNVHDLPEEGRPAEFSGDVGDYNLSVEYDRRELTQNDALTIKVTVSGAGYLKSLSAPKIALPSGFDYFAPTSEEKVSIVGEEMRGRKVFTYLVIPRRTGRFTLEPVRFSYFHPGSKSYRTAAAGGITLDIAPSATGVASSGGVRSLEVSLLDSDIRFLKSVTGDLKRLQVPPYRMPFFYILMVLPPFLFYGGVLFEMYRDRLSADPTAVRRRRAPGVMSEALRTADRRLQKGDALPALEAATRGLEELVGALIDEPSAGLTSDLIRSRLETRGTSDALVAEVLSLLAASDRARFGLRGIEGDETVKILVRMRDCSKSLEALL